MAVKFANRQKPRNVRLQMSESKDDRDTCSSALKSVAKKRRRRGPGFFSLLGLLFIGLKLTGHIDWSWWWVLAPIWIKFAVLILVIVIVGIVKKRTGWKSSGET